MAKTPPVPPRPGQSRVGWLFWLLLVMPVITFMAGGFFAGNFVGTPHLWVGCGVVALLHVALGWWAGGYSLRRDPERTARRQALPAGFKLTAALLAFLALWGIDDAFAAAELAWAIGTPETVAAHVSGKSRSYGKGCNFYVYLSVPGSSEEFSRCTDGSLWQTLHRGEPVSVQIRFSPLGDVVMTDPYPAAVSS